MKFDILVNLDYITYVDKDTNSFITEDEKQQYLDIAEAVESLVKYGDKVSLRNIKIITGIPTRDLEDFISFILAAEELAETKYI